MLKNINNPSKSAAQPPYFNHKNLVRLIWRLQPVKYDVFWSCSSKERTQPPIHINARGELVHANFNELGRLVSIVLLKNINNPSKSAVQPPYIIIKLGEYNIASSAK
jgi:hypothetical protein